MSDDAPIEVPPEALDPEVLRRLLEERVSRDGTDYGLHERSLEQKVAELMRALQRGEAVIRFDPADETVEIVLRDPPR